MARPRGTLKAELSAEGRRQAQEVAVRLAATNFDFIYSSDLRRARDTAMPLALRQALPIIEEPGLREWHMGQFEGMTYSQVKVKAGNDYERFHNFDPGYAAPGGEAYAEFHQRVLTALQTIACRHPSRHVAIFTHGGAVLALLRHLNRLPLDSAKLYKIPNTCITRMACPSEDEPSTWELIETAATPFEKNER
jgi:2,3-bisphosphoglycerate-dependent phosphoglycerate mutase